MQVKKLPEGWQIIKFGDIAKHISKRVEPSKTDLDIYVGLEHLEPGSLKIKRHGVPSDVDAQKLLVKKGQIIFGKRRAYQRKVAVATWDCICSAHAMVLEAIPDKVIPEFLPFFMQSDIFMNRAVEISEGSLSPTIKWKILAEQIFKFPNKEKQKQLIKLFQVLEKTLSASNNLLDAAQQKKSIIMHNLLTGKVRLIDENGIRFNKNYSTVPFNEIFIISNKKSAQVSSSNYKPSGEIPIVDQGQDFISGYCDNEESYKDYPVIIFGDHTKCIKWVDFEFCPGADGTQILNTTEIILKKYGYYLLCNTHIIDLGYSRHMKELKRKSFLVTKNYNEQRKIVHFLELVDEEINLIQHKINKLRILKNNILLNLFH